MSVNRISGKRITVQGQKSNLKQRNVAHEPIHRVTKTEQQSNVKTDELFKVLIDKIDSIKPTNVNMYGEEITPHTSPVEVDLEQQLYIDKADRANLKSEVVSGKVNNKVNKLRALRKRHGS